MLKSSLHLQPNRLGEAAIAASRQVWLASLGAAVVTRDWVQTEAGDVFKTLVKEGTVVESQPSASSATGSRPRFPRRTPCGRRRAGRSNRR